MREIYSDLEPLMCIYCSCGCGDYIKISRMEDEPPYYLFAFKDKNFYPLGHRLKLALTPRKNYSSPVSLIIEKNQYAPILEVLTQELKSIPEKEFTFYEDPKYPGDRFYDFKYEELYKGSIHIVEGISIELFCWNEPELNLIHQEFNIYPMEGTFNKPQLKYILSPTFQKEEECTLSRDALMEFAQFIQYLNKM